MQLHKLEFSHDVMRIVREICQQVFNVTSETDFERVFGITYEQMDVVVKKISNSLPNIIFDRLYPHLLDEVKNICAREFVFFQVQEKWKDPHYQDDLVNFISIFSRDICSKIDIKNHTLRINEE